MDMGRCGQYRVIVRSITMNMQIDHVRGDRPISFNVPLVLHDEYQVKSVASEWTDYKSGLRGTSRTGKEW
jgi:hypothetical protein